MGSMRTYFNQGVLPEMIHDVHGTLPSLTEYTELRVDSSGFVVAQGVGFYVIDGGAS